MVLPIQIYSVSKLELYPLVRIKSGNLLLAAGTQIDGGAIGQTHGQLRVRHTSPGGHICSGFGDPI